MMAIYKRGGVYWYGFVFKNERIQESTHQTNKRVAEQIQAAHKTALAKGEVGIRDRVQVPTFRQFSERFVEHIETQCDAKPATVEFYKSKLDRLLECQFLAALPLDAIDESIIDRYITSRKQRVLSATVNRELATLRRALRLAYKWKIIARLPQIQLLQGERERNFVLIQAQEAVYLGAAVQPLHDVALLLLDTGLRVSEALNLQRPSVHLQPTPGAQFGYLRVEDGKSKNARRNVPLTARVTAMLKVRQADAQLSWVFASEKTGGPWVPTSINHQHERLRGALKLPKDFVIHSFRHTCLTRLGESGADAFTIMRIAGHSSVTVSQRYVHPSPETVERAFERLERMNATMRKNAAESSEMQRLTTVSTTLEPSSNANVPSNLMQ